MNFTERIKAAYAVVRGNAKAIPFNASGGQGWATWGSWTNPYQNTRLNYQQEAGDLGGSSLIMAAVNYGGTVLPEAPIQVVKKKASGEFEAIAEHPMVDLLEHPTRYFVGDSEREYYAGELLWKAWMFSWVVDGNAYFRKVRNSFGQVIQLWYEPHFTIRPRWPQDGSEFISDYEVLRNGQWYPVETDDVIHFRYGIDPQNDRLGLSPVASLYREVFTDNERARYSALILRNGGVIPWVLSPDAGTSGVGLAANEIKTAWEYATTGDNVGRPMVLQGPVKAQRIGSSPDEMLVDKASKIPEERVAAVLGIPAAVLGYGVGMEQTKVGATMRELREQAYEGFVIPTQRLAAGELRSQLLPEFGDTKGLKVAHDLSQVRVLQDDRGALFTRETLAYEKGVKTRAEVRQALGLKTKPEDDVYFVLAATEQPEPAPADIQPDPIQQENQDTEN